jgi:serine/threonine protein kinase
MAPEQARNARTADIRADIYSLGCVFYHTLTGQPPFPDTSLLHQMIRHASELPRPLRELNPQVPEGFQKIMDGMLAKDPAQRYATPEQAAQALRVFLADKKETFTTPEAEAPLDSYLRWVDTECTRDYAAMAAASTAPSSKAAPGRSTTAPASSSRAEKRKRRISVGTGTGAEEAQKVSATESPDVELVPMGPSQKNAAEAGEGFQLTRRDYLMLGVGAGSVLGAVFLGWLLAQRFRRKEGSVEPSKREADEKEN